MAGVGLVLGAGGTLGHAYHTGTLAALAEATGWEPRAADIVVGTSAGSGVAAALRAGFSAGDLAARQTGRQLSPEGRRLAARLGPPVNIEMPRASSRQWIASAELLRRALLRPGSVRAGAVVAAALPEGEVPTEVIAAGIRRLHGDRWPEQPTWICAVRLDDGERVVFGREGSPAVSLADAVAASCAIPAVYHPVTLHGRRYVDGGVHSVTNLDLVAGLGLDLVIVVVPMAGRPEAILGSLDMPIRAAAAARLATETSRVRRQGTPVVALQPNRADVEAMGINLMDWRRRARVTHQAQASAREWLDRPANRQRLESILQGSR